MTDQLRAQELSRLAGILTEADAAHEHSLALAARALELDRALDIETTSLGFDFAEVALEAQRRANYSATIWVGSARQSGWRVGVAAR